MRPFITIDRFLGEDAAEELLRRALARESYFVPSKVKLGETSSVDPTHRIVLVDIDSAPWRARLESAMREAMDAAMPRLGIVNIRSYRIELEIGWCGNGGFFKVHTDTFSNGEEDQRIVTMVYYLHHRPKAFTGGQLRLFGLGEREGHCIGEIEPAFDSAVIFPSWIPHEILPVVTDSHQFSAGRFAVTCWLRRG
jgi:SM-20-related protein